MVNIYKGLKRRGGKKKLLKIGILGLKFKFFVMLFLKIFCIIWKKIDYFYLKEKKYMKKWKEKKLMWYMKILLDLIYIWYLYKLFFVF